MMSKNYFERKYCHKKPVKIDYEPAEYYDKRFAEHPKLFRTQKSITRNEDFLKMIQSVNFNHVFEFAGGSGKLAEMFCDDHPECIEYVTTDFSEEAIKLANEYTKNYEQIKPVVLDITKDQTHIYSGHYDLIICTSMEHIPKDESIKILKAVPKGTPCLFAGADFLIEWSNSHCHVHNSLQYCKEFYGKYLKSMHIHYQPGYRSYAVYGVKK